MDINKKPQNSQIAINSYQVALVYIELGFRIFPCKLDKTPAVKGWKAYALTREEIDKKYPRGKYLYGIHCNQGFFAFDKDQYNKEWNKKSQEISEILEAHCRVTQKTMNKGTHFLVRGDFPNSTSILAKGIDTKGSGGYIIIYNNPYSIKHDSISDFLALMPHVDEIVKEIALISHGNEALKKLGYAHKINKIEYKKPDVWEEGERDTEFYKELTRCMRDGDKEGVILAIEKARRSGLSEKEIAYKVRYYAKKIGAPVTGFDILEPAKPTPEQATGTNKKNKIVKPTPEQSRFFNKKPNYNLEDMQSMEQITYNEFIPGLLLHHNLNLLTGPKKIGKSRFFYLLLGQRLKELNKKAIILSIENDAKDMIKPVLQKIGLEQCFLWADPGLGKYFPVNATYPEKIQTFLERCENILSQSNDIEGFFLDPTPQVLLDYNNEQLVVMYFDGLATISKEQKVCTLAVRNFGKNILYSGLDKSKGSTAQGDYVRNFLLALDCHPRSFLFQKGLKAFKENHPNDDEQKYLKPLIITNKYASSLQKPTGFLGYLKLEDVDGYSKPHAIPYLAPNLNQIELNHCEFLSSMESGRKPILQIIELLRKKRKLTADEIRDYLPWIDKTDITQTLYNYSHERKRADGTMPYVKRLILKNHLYSNIP